jgi:hypothetical protein
MARSGMKIFVFMAWEYNVLEAGSRWSSKIIVNISSFFPNLQGSYKDA